MTATKHGEQALPTNAPKVTLEYIPGVGETETREWKGERTDVLAKYTELKYGADGGATVDGNLTGLMYTSDGGRTACMMRIERNNVVNEYGTDVKVVEELYAIDVIRDVLAAPYFVTAVATKLTDDQAAWVSECVDKHYTEAQIDVEAVKFVPAKPLWAAWTAGMKELKYHLRHGVDSYYETAFILRRSLYGVITSKIKIAFTGINTVVTAPEFGSAMDDLIGELPTGEWLYKPPQSEHLSKAKWRITQEWHWAEKWSKIYGGTWGL